MKSRMTSIYALTATIILLSLSFANVAHADASEATFNFLAGSGFLCSLGATACPDVASASSGDTIAITGSGTIEPGSNDAKGGGTFVHKNSAGEVTASGTWKVDGLTSFVDFGTAPGFPASFHSGVAVLQVELTSSTGAETDAVLVIGCALVSPPPPGDFEGITLNVEGGPNFSTVVSGFTIFILAAEA